MKTHQDAYGQLLYSYHKNGESFEIFERSDGLFDVGDPSNYFTTCNDWSRPHREALKYARGRILDVGCGAGKHALYLQEKGLDVLGIDISPLAVNVCKLRGLKNAKALSVTQISKKLGIFDTIIMMGNNFGLFGNWKRAKWLLRKFHGMTGEQGRIIGETLDPYQTKDPAHLAYQKSNRKNNRMGGQVRMRIRYRQYVSPWMDYLFVSRDEMQKILEGTGWRVSQFINTRGPGYIAIIEKT